MEAIKEALGVGRFASVAECVEAARALCEDADMHALAAIRAEGELEGLRYETSALFAEVLRGKGYAEEAVTAACAQWLEDPQRVALALLGSEGLQPAQAQAGV